MVSVGYIARLLAGREAVVCAAVQTSEGPRSVLIEAADDHAYCVVIFAVVYFFSTSGCVWWVVLALMWSLRNSETVERHVGVIHAVAWTPPTIQTIAMLRSRSVEADELAGTCRVAGGAPARLVSVAASAAFLVAGTAFLTSGMFRVRRQNGVETEEPTTCRVRVFCVFCLVSAVVDLSCRIHEYVATVNWLASSDPRLNSTVQLLEIVSTLVLGVASGVWIWDADTLRSWKSLFDRLVSKRDR